MLPLRSSCLTRSARSWRRGRVAGRARRRLALRSRIVLAAAEGLKNTEIAERLGVNRGDGREVARRGLPSTGSTG